MTNDEIKLILVLFYFLACTLFATLLGNHAVQSKRPLWHYIPPILIFNITLGTLLLT